MSGEQFSYWSRLGRVGRMSIHHRLSGIALAAGMALLVGGCSSAAEPPTSASPSASVTPPVVAALEFSGSDVRSTDADRVTIDSVEFSGGPAAVVDFIATALGLEPTVTEEEEQCAPAHTRYAWEGVAVTQWAETAEFVVGFDESTIGSVRIETSGGFAVGDDVSAFVQTLPAENVARQGGDDIFVAFDVVDTVTQGEYSSPRGAVGHVPGGSVLQSVLTPGEWSSFLC
jgi:hypothetical protein